MEHSPSLRFLEASGRSSGTGRPSLQAPRNEHARDTRKAVRKDIEHARPVETHEPQTPFATVLGDAEHAPAKDEKSQPESATTSSKQPAATNADKLATKSGKPARKQQPELDLSKDGEPADADATTLAVAPNATPAERKPVKLRADALPLPAAAALAAPDAQQLAEASTTPATDADPALAIEAPTATVAAATDLAAAAARETSSTIPALQAPAARVEAPELLATKAPPAPPPPADSSRASEILRQLRVQLSPELHSATIQLSPPELGRISIRLRVEGGEMHAVVRAEKRETLDALQRHVPELKATLEALGIQARQFDLELGFEHRGASRNPQEAQTAGRNSADGDHDSTTREDERRLARTLSARVGGVDTYA